MRITSNVSFTGNNDLDPIKQKYKDLKNEAKNNEIKQSIKNLKNNPNNPEAIERVKTNIVATDTLINKVKQIGTDLKSSTLKSLEPEDKTSKWLVNGLKRFSNSNVFKNLVKNEKGIGIILALGNTCKEAMGTAIYTVQALTNEDLPPDKRKFVGMYDLAVGVVSTTLSLVFGIATVKYQDKLVERTLKKFNKPELYPKYNNAFAGIKFFIPLILQNIIIKRMVAPAVATPVAGQLKKKMEAKEAAQQPKTDTTIPPNNDIILSSSDIKSQDKTAAPKIENIFAVYKQATQDPTKTA